MRFDSILEELSASLHKRSAAYESDNSRCIPLMNVGSLGSIVQANAVGSGGTR